MGDPLRFTPREFSGWSHRFDDPEREYRTIYCAERRITCFRETLAKFRPDTRTISEFQRLFGNAPKVIGEVPRDWLDRQALAPGRIEVQQGALINVDDPVLRREFESQHAAILTAHGMDHFDITEIRSHNRIVSRTLSRFVFNRGAAGILYRSNLDDLACVALFEDRARVTPDGKPELVADLPIELLDACKEFGLRIPPDR